MTTVREAMNVASVTVGTGHTMREAARRMTAAGTGAAVVIDPELPAPGIVTERDLMQCVGHGCDPDEELVAAHVTTNVVYAAPDWPLERAAEQMVKGTFRHIIVLEGSEIAGILSMRDIVSRWVREAALAGGAAIF
jgi:signal-transduction protein with cAMP-binding, CBS, and nucleotidyltransferase domain